MSLILGPVIGHVSHTQIRILVEVDQVCALELEVFPRDIKLKNQWSKAGKSFKIRKEIINPFRPVALVLKTNDPDFRNCYDFSYKITSERGKTSSVIAENRFKLPKPEEPTKLLVVSCNALHKLNEGELDLWACIERDYVNKDTDVAALLHIGDQVYEYTRDVWKRCHNYMLALQRGFGIVKGTELLAIDKDLDYAGEWVPGKEEYDREQVLEICVELFRSLYRQSWKHPPTRAVLARLPNHMIADDHDFRNGWGIKDEDRTPGTIEYDLGRAAHQAYEEYQVQLWRDIDTNYHVDYRSLSIGSSCIFLMDVRNPRTFCYDPKTPYVGHEQMDFLKQSLDAKTRTFVLVCSIPIVLGSQYITCLMSHADFTEDIRDQWAQGENVAEHCEILSLLAKWKKQDPTRQIILVGGDIHMGLHSKIFVQDECIMEQIVTSPLTNTPTQGLVGWLQDVFSGTEFTLYNKFRVLHDYKLHERNYAEITIQGTKWSYKLITS